LRIVDRERADLVGNASCFRLDLLQQSFALQDFEGVRGRSPKDVYLVVALGFLNIFHTRVGVAVLDLQRGARMGLLEGFFEGVRYIL
jgi:hypothetical protein